MSNEVNLQSVDAMFATVLSEIRQVRGLAEETRDLVRTNEQRVSTLERENLMTRSKIAGAIITLSLVVSSVGWIIQQGIGHLFNRP